MAVRVCLRQSGLLYSFRVSWPSTATVRPLVILPAWVATRYRAWISMIRANRRGASEAMRVRVGISTGDVTFEGGDCFGLPVVEAQRLEASAEPARSDAPRCFVCWPAGAAGTLSSRWAKASPRTGRFGRRLAVHRRPAICTAVRCLARPGRPWRPSQTTRPRAAPPEPDVNDVPTFDLRAELLDRRRHQTGPLRCCRSGRHRGSNSPNPLNVPKCA